MDLIGQIEGYKPYNQQEAADKELILRCLRERPHVFSREDALAHMTASAWVVNPGWDKVLMVYHNLYHSWSWMGGHADGERDLLAVALREVREESGILQVAPVTEEIFSLEVLTVDGHEKRGSYVPSHLHLNVTYLFQAPEEQELIFCPEENSGVLWLPVQEALEKTREEWFRQRVYPKLNEKLAAAAAMSGKV